MISIKHEINLSWWLLRIVYGVTFIAAGADKFFGFVTNWQQFVTPDTAHVTGLPVGMIVMVMGVIEIALGVFIFTRWVKITSLFIAVWMITNGCYLLYSHIFLDTAARYCTLGLLSLVLFHLTRVREKLLHS